MGSLGIQVALSKFRSIGRAIKRGHFDIGMGMIIPKRPFNNRKSTPGRKQNELKKTIHGQLKHKAGIQ